MEFNSGFKGLIASLAGAVFMYGLPAFQ